MADAAEDVLSEDDLTEGLEKKSLSGKIIIIIAVLAVALIVAVVLLLFTGGGDDHKDDGIDQRLDDLAEGEAARQSDAEAAAARAPEETALIFVDIPQANYNLNTGGDGASFLRIKISLEVDRQSFADDLQTKMPRIMDEFNVYMRELRPADLEGAAGIFRLKEELLRRINQTVAPTRVNDILFEEFIIQGG